MQWLLIERNKSEVLRAEFSARGRPGVLLIVQGLFEGR